LKHGTNITYGITVQLNYKNNKNTEQTSLTVSQYKIKKTTITNHNTKYTLLFTVIKNHNRIRTSLYTVIKIHNKHKHNHTIKLTARYVGLKCFTMEC